MLVIIAIWVTALILQTKVVGKNNSAQNEQGIEIYSIKIYVADMDKAIAFYKNNL